MKEGWKNNRSAILAIALALVLSAACSSDNNPVTNPTTGGAADIDVLNSTPASGDTNISGSGVTVATTLADADTTRVQVDATTGGNKRQVTVYFTTATGAVEHVTYAWGVASLFENIVHCDAAVCTNVSVNTTTREIAFAGTALDDRDNPFPGDPATTFATLGQAVPASMVQFPAP